MERNLSEIKTEFKRFDNKLSKIDNLHTEIVDLEKHVEAQYNIMKEKFTSVESFAIKDREDAKADRDSILQEVRIVYEYKKDLEIYNKKLEGYKFEI